MVVTQRGAYSHCCVEEATISKEAPFEHKHVKYHIQKWPVFPAGAQLAREITLNKFLWVAEQSDVLGETLEADSSQGQQQQRDEQEVERQKPEHRD